MRNSGIWKILCDLLYFVSFGVLVSTPIAGTLLDAVEASGKLKYWGVAVFTGLCYAGALLSFIWVRWRLKGGDWRAKF
jgi:hypothetical protein